MKPDTHLEWILSRLRGASDEEEAELGRTELASFLLHARPELVDKVVKIARRDNAMRRCLSAARYYSGLKQETCAKIDAVLQAPFPAARRK